MFNLRKVVSYVLVFFMVFHLVPFQVFANSVENDQEFEILEDIEEEHKIAILLSEQPGDLIQLYKDLDNDPKEIKHEIPEESAIIVIQDGEEYSLIEYIDFELDVDGSVTEDEVTLLGYVHNDHIFSPDDADDIISSRETETDIDDSDQKDSSSNSNDISEEDAEVVEEDTGNNELRADDLNEDVNDKDENNSSSSEDNSHNGASEIVEEEIIEEDIDNELVRYNGVALNDPTHVYEDTSTNSNQLRSYNKGHILIYETFNSEWYQATVYLEGVPHSGYIHKDDVDTINQEDETIEGYAQKDPTPLYTSTSLSSDIITNYDLGDLLSYQSFTTEWYIVSSQIDDDKIIGYLHVDDVGEEVQTFQSSQAQTSNLRGVALKNPTIVYSSTSRNSSTLKDYNSGHILRYRAHNSSWYQATVILNGKAHNGYIHHSDVVTASNDDQQNITGVGTKSPTNVYSTASRDANVLKGYNQGSILRYHSFSSGWYQATVILNGKAHTGYIHKSDTETINPEDTRLTGNATSSPTNVYARASTNSVVLKDYSRGSNLIFRTFTANWYSATVYVNNKAHTGYIHKSDINFNNSEYETTNYNYSFKQFIDFQLTKTPKEDGQGIYPANRKLVEHYANPANYSRGSQDYLQFLVLSQPAGIDPVEVNQSILRSAGTLTGTARDFVDAANSHQVNEIYLMAHALHETGNGTSQLARGVTVNGRTVYNMFGIGAFDGTAVSSGAQRAYDEGWFTPRDAIIGGAEFIANRYISTGRDTLYKMRWDPGNYNSSSNRQYATHVSWAANQTNRMNTIYNQLDNFYQMFDVPNFQSQPSSTNSTFIEFPSGITGRINSNVNYRSGPGTSHSSYGVLTTGTSVEIIGSNAFGWYQIKVNNRTAWVSSGFINTNNLIQTTATSLNVRSGPGPSHSSVGSLEYGSYARAIMNGNNYTTSGGWYNIHFNGNNNRWVSGNFIIER
jgi:beta-N-acetylglucosaminidase/uncharacterized protein YraI